MGRGLAAEMPLSLARVGGHSSILARSMRSTLSRNASLNGKGAVRQLNSEAALNSTAATDGELWAWGQNDEGNMKEPVFLPQVGHTPLIAAARLHSWEALVAAGQLCVEYSLGRQCFQAACNTSCCTRYLHDLGSF